MIKKNVTLNITDSLGNAYPYVAQWTSPADGDEGEMEWMFSISPSGDIRLFLTGSGSITRLTDNTWTADSPAGYEYIQNPPDTYPPLRPSTLTLYIPLNHSDNRYFILDASIMIAGKKITLGSSLIDTAQDLIATPSLLTFDGMSVQYYEQVSMTIVSPDEIIHGGEDESAKSWFDFFEKYLSKDYKTYTYKGWLNETPALSISLNPVDPSTQEEGIYIRSTDLDGCTGEIPISGRKDENDNTLTIILSQNLTSPSVLAPDAIHPDERYFQITPICLYTNDVIKNIQSDLQNYKDTSDPKYKFYRDIYAEQLMLYTRAFINNEYGILVSKIKNEIVVQDDENIWKIASNEIRLDEVVDRERDNGDISWWDFGVRQNSDPPLRSGASFGFDSWDEWRSGMYVSATLTATGSKVGSDDPIDIIYKSNRIPITQEMFKFMVFGPDESIKNYYNINRCYIAGADADKDDTRFSDMINNNINVVNKSVKVVSESDVASSGKSHFIKPVFFKVHDLASIVIHPEVTENICLNLDQYKSKVNVFKIQIEGVQFAEIGRGGNGVIFKIIGSRLPKKVMSGVYYILNDDREMVTSGKYTYES